MRRWFALSAICHGCVLVALALWPRATTRVERSVVFECEGGPEPASEILPPEPDPPEPRRELMPDVWAEESDPEDAELSEQVFDEPLKPTVRLQSSAIDARQLTVRLKRWRPRTLNKPESIASVAPRSPIVRGPTRAACPLGKPATISYPRRARRRGLEGTVVLRLLVDRTGSVQRVEIERSSGHATLDDAARKGIARWHFAPALRNGIAVTSWVERSVCFQLTAKQP